MAGASALALTVTGGNFVNGAVVQWNGSNRTTTFNSSTSLTATITTADLATAGVFPVTVLSASPTPGPSNSLNFTVDNPQPSITALSVNSVLAGANGFLLNVTGNNFVNGATVYWSGGARSTTFVSATSLAAAINAADLATAGTFPVTVNNPTPSAGQSSSVSFTVNNPQPTLSSLSSISAAAGSPPALITVSGSNFVNGATILVGGNARTTYFGSSTSLGFVPLTSDLASTGTLSISVQNPSPSLGVSNSLNFTVTGNNPAPTLASFSPATVGAGSASFTLTVYGNNFVPGSAVQWGGSPRATTFGSSQQISAIINIADVATTGTVAVTVFNPTPGGGTSSAIQFTVGSLPQGSITAQAANGVAAGPASVPLVLSLNSGVTAGALSLGVRVVPVGGAPAIAASIGFQSDAALPLPNGSSPYVSAGATGLGVFFGAFNTPLTGTVTLGILQVPIPANAAVGQSYTVQVTEADAAQGSAAVPLANGTDATLHIVAGYLAGDSFPHTTDSVGNFGDGLLNTLDLVDALRAVTNLSTPAQCSDRFDAIDTYPVDTFTVRGGDGSLNTLDLIATLRRVTNLDTSRPNRLPRGLACSEIAVESHRPPTRDISGTIEIEGNAIYLLAREDLNLSGLALSLTLPEGQQANFTPADVAASLVDVGQPGKIAVAWLQGLKLPARGRLLLGSVDGADRGGVLSVSANHADGNEVRIVAADRR